MRSPQFLLIIARQPDLRTAVTLLPVLFAVAFVAGMPMRIFGVLAVVAVLAAPFMEIRAPGLSAGACLDFLDPEADAQGCGIPATPGTDHHGIRRALGKRLPERNARPVAFPACGT